MDNSNLSLRKHKSDTNLIDLRYNSEIANCSKSGDELRRSYISKLVTNNILDINKEENHLKTIFIYDWDDTLFPTTFLLPNGNYADEFLNEEDLEAVSILDDYVYKILKNSILKGDTYIITNASPGWVEYSCYKFFQKTYLLLKKIKIISARGDFEGIYPKDRRKWKIESFQTIYNNLNPHQITNLICIGDSIFEMEAAHILASKFKCIYIKTVKMKERPNLKDMRKQINLITEDFNKIVNTVDNLIIKVATRQRKIH
jgi:hypothetical protein